MRYIFVAILLVCALLPGCALAGGQTAEEFAINAMDDLSAEKWEEVYASSDKQLQEAIGSAEGFEEMWAQLTGPFGSYESSEIAGTEEVSGYTVVQIDSSFANADVGMVLTLSDDWKLSGFSVVSVASKVDRAVAADGSYIEEPILLRAGEKDESNGLLTLPEGDGPFPAVIMVHGSGSSDLNETIFSNVPFLDLARGLAKQGVASIRYDKYTYAHANLWDENSSLEEEYMMDVRDAAALLLEDARIDRIYILGHSMGAMLAPRIMEEIQEEAGDALAGAVLLSGSPLHLWEIQYRQNMDIIETLSDEEKSQHQALVDIELAKEELLADMTDEELRKETFFGVSAYYQHDEMSVDAVETAIQNGFPLFIAQGAKDWQVHLEDGVELWREKLENKVDATYKVYPDMNHMLSDMEGESTGTMNDYLDADAHVAQALIEDIAQWILSNEASM